MAAYSGAQRAKTFKDENARKLIHEGLEANAICFILNKNKVESLHDNGRLDTRKFTYLISLRTGYLPLRIGNSFEVEPYNPDRSNRQFGFCQDIPGMLPRSVGRHPISHYEAVRYWKLLLFSGSNSRVFLPSHFIKWYKNATSEFKKWWKAVGAHDLRVHIKPLLRGIGIDLTKSKKG
ncbi:hypothetical protein RND81_08G142500 [Saponaria officinalis]|uniref:Uncharacterized protein n=1 Tax=Saponaria officinalis TaxID=3572 RepID=A0AAW1J826_SAPOF